ncbi:hypothetical protein [Agreia bicolorata]|uniref:Transmembrane protein n=1 Tax=Agreia bicolorata TaxID=110935 RepID=A0ABR5CDH4_9MICO|nr:hypothetical protein [Agreia bicolorata]KJC63674.1 hypothetical protein TZ00_14325 [Agreia bicolorata]
MTFASVKRILLVAAIVAVVVGSVAAVVSAAQPMSFAWIAYAPLSREVFNPNSTHLIAAPTIYALTVVALGLIAAAFWAGLVVGERRSRD